MRVPRQNRVTPLGEIVAVPDRGTFMGHRGCLHAAAVAHGSAAVGVYARAEQAGEVSTDPSCGWNDRSHRTHGVPPSLNWNTGQMWGQTR